jgi:hypothetical protein
MSVDERMGRGDMRRIGINGDQRQSCHESLGRRGCRERFGDAKRTGCWTGILARNDASVLYNVAVRGEKGGWCGRTQGRGRWMFPRRASLGQTGMFVDTETLGRWWGPCVGLGWCWWDPGVTGNGDGVLHDGVLVIGVGLALEGYVF